MIKSNNPHLAGVELIINSAQRAVIYSILRCQMARTRVNMDKTLLFTGFRSRHDLRFF